jgi:hypothetical protein
VLDNGSFTILSGTITNNANIIYASVGSSTYLALSGNVTLSGNGTLTMDNSGADVIYSPSGTETLTIGSGQTIQGAGQMGLGQTTFVNNGTITANQSNALILQPGSSGGFTNSASGILQASGVGTLQLSAGVFTNNGTIQAVGGSLVQLINNANVVGGTLATASSQIHSISSTLTNLTNSGSLVLDNGSFTTLSGTITNNGNIGYASAGSSTYLALGGNVTLSGNGTLTMDNSGADILYSPSGTDTLTIGSAQTIQGAGQLGREAALLQNQVASQADDLVHVLDEDRAGLHAGAARRARALGEAFAGTEDDMAIAAATGDCVHELSLDLRAGMNAAPAGDAACGIEA